MSQQHAILALKIDFLALLYQACFDLNAMLFIVQAQRCTSVSFAFVAELESKAWMQLNAWRCVEIKK